MSTQLNPKEPETDAGRNIRQTYLEIARMVLGESNMDYATLYQRFVSNEWAAIKLDDAVALAALKSGHSAKDAFMLLLQGPYVQHQAHEKQVVKTALGRYVKSTVREAMSQLKGQRRGITPPEAN